MTDLDRQTRAVLDTPVVIPDLVREHSTRMAGQRQDAARMLRELEQAGVPPDDPLRRYWQGRAEANLDFHRALLHETCADLLRQLARETGLFTRIAALAQLSKLADSQQEQEAVQTILTEVVHAAAWRVVTTAHEDAAGQELEYLDDMPVFSEAEQERIDAESRGLIARVRAVLGATPGR